ncbi:unnamed protein product [Cunninghamella blakesleeana]
MALNTTEYNIKLYENLERKLKTEPQSYVERYFSFYEYKKDENYYVRQAPNKLCIVGLKSVVSLKEEESEPTIITPGSMLCKINDQPIYANMHGKLLELNTRLETEPSLLVTDPIMEGFIAIIQPKQEDPSKQLQDYNLITPLTT